MDEIKPFLYKHWELALKLTFLLFILCALVTSCGYINGKLNQEPDWWGEQLIESLIEQETGLKIDLTP